MRLVLGISGGIGSGKSTVSRVFQSLGAEILNADQMAHDELEKNSVKRDLQSRFGDGIVLPNGNVDRKGLAKIVFNDDAARQYLEELIHPNIRKEIEERINQSQSDIVVLDVPLIDNSPLLKHCTHKIFLEVDDKERLRRVKERGWTEKEWKQREAAQVSIAEKKATAHWILNNNQDLQKVEEEIKHWIKETSEGNP